MYQMAKAAKSRLKPAGGCRNPANHHLKVVASNSRVGVSQWNYACRAPFWGNPGGRTALPRVHCRFWRKDRSFAMLTQRDAHRREAVSGKSADSTPVSGNGYSKSQDMPHLRTAGQIAPNTNPLVIQHHQAQAHA